MLGLNILVFLNLNYLVMFRGINAIQFSKGFTNNEACYLYLIEKKWARAIVAAVVDALAVIKAGRIITAAVKAVVMMKV